MATSSAWRITATIWICAESSPCWASTPKSPSSTGASRLCSSIGTNASGKPRPPTPSGTSVIPRTLAISSWKTLKTKDLQSNYDYVNRHCSDCSVTLPVMSQTGHLRLLEAESIHILREVASEFQRPVMLYSIGKDSSVLLRLAQKAFFPGPIPFPLLHIDTGYKFREMIEFRDSYTSQIGARLIVHTNRQALADGAQPFTLGTQRCCGLLKTQALLDGLREGGFNAAFGGARRDEEKSRAKERIYSFRDAHGQWDPKNQRPELWNLFNSRIDKNESIRVFPLSNWTELDIWLYIHVENIPIVPLYFAKERPAVIRNGSLILIHSRDELRAG